MGTEKSKVNIVKEDILRNCDLTASNYANLANKLQKRKSVFQVLLPIYSVIGILNGLLPKFFDFFTPIQIDLLSFWGVVISITFLVVSMQITLARYPERISETTKILNDLKVLKGKIKKTEASNLEEFKDLYETYNSIVRNGVFIGRRFFYETCRDVDKKNRKIRKIKSTQSPQDTEVESQKESSNLTETARHFGWFEILYIFLLAILENLLYLLIFILPIIVYIFIFGFSGTIDVALLQNVS